MGDNFTGRKYDHDVLENEEQVSAIIDSLNTTADTDVGNAKSETMKAVDALNQLKGMADYVGTVPSKSIEGIFDEITDSIGKLATAMRDSADSIKVYDESEWYEKAGSTILMGACKIGEGLLNVIEDLSDGAISLVGFVTQPLTGSTEWAENIINPEWSHDVFNGYYESDLAKKSAITEDSGVSNAIKITGTTIGYMAIAAATAGAGSGLAGTGGAGATFASSTTIANTAVGAIGGLGSGTETGLRQGKGFNEAFTQNGLSQAAINGAIELFTGKIGEHMAKGKAVKGAKLNASEADDMLGAATKNRSKAIEKLSAAQSEYDAAEKALNSFKNKTGEFIDLDNYGPAFDRWRKAESSLTSATAEKNAAETLFQKQLSNSRSAHEALTKVSNTKAATFQGYSDKITNKFFKKGEKVGTSIRESYGANIANGSNKFISGTKAVAQGTKKAVAESSSHILHPVKTIKSAGSTLKNVATHPIQTAKTVGSTAGSAIKNTATHPIQTAKNVVKTVSPVTTKASVPGLVSNIGTSTYREIRQTNAVNASKFDINELPDTPFKSNSQTDIDNRINTAFNSPESSSSSTSSSSDTGNSSNGNTSSGNTSSGSTSSGNYSSGSTSGGNTSGGSTSGGSTPSYQSTVDPKEAEAQLKKTTAETDPVTEISKTAQTAPTASDTLAPADTPVQTTPQETPAAVVQIPAADVGGYDTTYHTGGGYSGEGFTSADTGDQLNDINTAALNPLDTALLDNSASIDEIVKGSKYTKIPSSSKPITTTTSTGSGSSSVIPIAAGLSAAAAAGIGAKAYMDRKKNNDFDDEDDDFETEEWSGDDDSTDIEYDETSDTQLDSDDDYSYQAEPEEKYGARSNEELADLQ